MTYFVTKHLENPKNTYAIFTNSYQWSDWQPTLAEAFSAMRYHPITHSSTQLANNPSVYLNQAHLFVTKLPTLPTYPEFIAQYPEFFL